VLQNVDRSGQCEVPTDQRIHADVNAIAERCEGMALHDLLDRVKHVADGGGGHWGSLGVMLLSDPFENLNAIAFIQQLDECKSFLLACLFPVA